MKFHIGAKILSPVTFFNNYQPLSFGIKEAPSSIEKRACDSGAARTHDQ